MSKYSVEEVRIEADELRAAGYDSTADMMIAFAKRIKAYESAVPIGWQIRIGDSDSWGFCRYECDADFLGRQSGLQYEKRPLFDHPPAQAAQVAADMLPVELADVAGEWYQLCERAAYVDKIKISGKLAEAIVSTVRRSPTAEPAAQGEPNIPTVIDDLTFRLIEAIEERDSLRAALAAQPRAVPDGWVPTSENINQLPDPVRKYIYALETNADPAGMVRENVLVHEENDMLRAALAAAPSQGESA